MLPFWVREGRRVRTPVGRWPSQGRAAALHRPHPRQALTLRPSPAPLQAFFLWRSYELHIEIQLYSRSWISQKITPVPPLSGTCFAPSTVARTEYNLTLSQSPNYIDLHAGLGLRLGSDCYDFASTIPRHPVPGMVLPAQTVFHTYWRADLARLGERQVHLLHSILATQDRPSTSVILWTNDDGSSLRNDPLLRPLLATYGGRLEVWPVTKKALAVGTPMEGHRLLEMADEKAWLDGDLVRILVLWAHGGVWVDMDTIMAGRDMRVLLESEWVTQWDCYGAWPPENSPSPWNYWR